jgi:hypothetical protein
MQRAHHRLLAHLALLLLLSSALRRATVAGWASPAPEAHTIARPPPLFAGRPTSASRLDGACLVHNLW